MCIDVPNAVQNVGGGLAPSHIWICIGLMEITLWGFFSKVTRVRADPLSAITQKPDIRTQNAPASNRLQPLLKHRNPVQIPQNHRQLPRLPINLHLTKKLKPGKR